MTIGRVAFTASRQRGDEYGKCAEHNSLVDNAPGPNGLVPEFG